jgi:hypothetical protein
MDLRSLVWDILGGIALEMTVRAVLRNEKSRCAIMKERHYLDTLSLAQRNWGTGDSPETEIDAENHELWERSLRHGTFGPPSSNAWDYLFSDFDETLRIDLGGELRLLRRMTVRLPSVDAQSDMSLAFLRAVERQCERVRAVVWHRKIRGIRTPRDARRWAKTATREEMAELALYASQLLREGNP